MSFRCVGRACCMCDAYLHSIDLRRTGGLISNGTLTGLKAQWLDRVCESAIRDASVENMNRDSASSHGVSPQVSLGVSRCVCQDTTTMLRFVIKSKSAVNSPFLLYLPSRDATDAAGVAPPAMRSTIYLDQCIIVTFQGEA